MSMPVSSPDDELSERERELLAFERTWFRHPSGVKEQAVREAFDLGIVRYFQELNALIDRPAALRHDPMLVKRLRRQRELRQQQRSAKRLGINLRDRA